MRSSLVEYLLKENGGRGREEGLLEEEGGIRRRRRNQFIPEIT